MRVLVVDDSRLARSAIIKTLKKEFGEDNEIIEAENGQIAVEKYEENSPELVFLDLTMPVMDGFEALKQIKTINKKAYVVVVSADVQEHAVEKVMSDGAVMHVQKPINSKKMQEIFKTVKFLLKVESK